MCDLCEKWAPDLPYCVDCGRLVCFDVEIGDDVLGRACVTEGGDLRCSVCGPRYDEVDELDEALAMWGHYPGDLLEGWDG